MSSWGATAAATATEDQSIHPPPQTVFRKPMLDFSPELCAAPSWEHPSTTKKRPPSTAGSVKKKRGTPARRTNTTTTHSNNAWTDWKTDHGGNSTALKSLQQAASTCTTAAPDSDTSTDSAGATFRFTSFPASLPRISAPDEDTTNNTTRNDESSFSLLMATPRAKLDFATGMSGSSLQPADHHRDHPLFSAQSSYPFQHPSFASSATADVSSLFTKSASAADNTDSTAPLTPNRIASSECPDTPREVQLHFTDAGCSPIPAVPAIPEEKSGSSTSSRPLPDLNAFGDVNSSSSSSEPRLLCPPTPIRTPAWAGGRISSPDRSLLDTKILAGDDHEDSSDYQVIATLGRGNFADVFKITTSNGKNYALKYHRRAFRGHRDRAAAVKEVQVMQQLQQHPHVLQLHRAWQCGGHFLLQTELCCRATCRDLLDCHNGLPMDVVAKIGHDVADGLSFVHAAGFVHNDIKPSNILFHLLTSDCKIGDFGLAVASSDVDCFVEGDQRYMAPEALNENTSRAASDVFSLGLTLYEAGSGAMIPSEGARWHALRNGSASDVFGTINSDLERLVASMMHPTPTERPTASSVCGQLATTSAAPHAFLRTFVTQAEQQQQPPSVLHSPPERLRLHGAV